MKPLFDLTNPLEMRWINPENPTGARGAGGRTGHGRKGSPNLPDLLPGQTQVLADFEGSGTIRRIWVTISQREPEVLRGCVIRFYWDGAQTPAIEAPLGDFFACPLGRIGLLDSQWFDTAEGRNFNCRLPMPFKTGFKVTITNDSSVAIETFWYHFDVTVGNRHAGDTGYLHAHYRRENPTTLRRDFEILPKVTGRGRFLGTAFGVICNTREYARSWWGEGEVKIYLDGDTEFSTLCGTGTEDYLCTSWGQGQYSLPWFGCPVADEERMQYAMYRFHGPDPVFFQREIRVTIQQLGYTDAAMSSHRASLGLGGVMKAGDGTEYGLPAGEPGEPGKPGETGWYSGLFERQDDWCATAYFYLDRPENDLPSIENFAARIAGLDA